MLIMKFNNNDAVYNVGFSQEGDIVQLTGEIPQNTSGFKVYRLNNYFLGDYSEYTEIVAVLENGLRFSKQKG